MHFKSIESSVTVSSCFIPYGLQLSQETLDNILTENVSLHKEKILFQKFRSEQKLQIFADLFTRTY